MLALFAAALCVPLFGQAAAAATPPSAERFYAQALEHMRERPQPAFATYDATMQGLRCIVDQSSVGCTLAGENAQTQYAVSYRGADRRIALQSGGKAVALADLPFLDATWPEIDALIRYGFGTPPDARHATPAPLQTDPSSHLPVIAVVSSLAAEHYRVADEGAAPCANGDPGHEVHLVARHDPLLYPLSDAVVDLRTDTFCMLRFGARADFAAGLAGANGSADLDLTRVDGYDIVKDERFAINLRAAGIAVKHIDVSIAYSRFAFPDAIPPAVFATPAPTAKPKAPPG